MSVTMSQGAIMQLESGIEAEFTNTPTGLQSNARLVLHNKPPAFNAVRHGLTAQHIILTYEDFPLYLQMGLDYMRELKPVGALETSNAQLIFESRWRTHRIMSVENDVFIYEPPLPAQAGPELAGKSPTRKVRKDRQVNAFREDARNVDLISRYETRLIRNASRLTIELKEMRKERAAASPELVFDPETSPAVLWYKKILAEYEELKQAREDCEANQAAQVTENKPQNSFGKTPAPKLDKEVKSPESPASTGVPRHSSAAKSKQTAPNSH